MAQEQSGLGDVGKGELRLSGPMFLHRLSVSIESQWPNMRFLGFGCYYAWIFLLYNSAVLARGASAGQSAWVITQMYLYSTVALAAGLVVSAMLSSVMRPVLERPGGVLLGGVIASASTLGCVVAASDNIVFYVCSLLTGIGTSLVALRFGIQYSKLDSRDTLMQTAVAFVFACLLYYMVIGVPEIVGSVVMVALPIFAAVLSLVDPDDDYSAAGHNASQPGLAKKPLSVSMLVRMVVMVFVFSLAVGVIRGFGATAGTATSIQSEGSLIVFGVCTVAVVLFVVGGLLRFNVDISRLYYPVILLVTAGIVLVPLVGEGAFLRSQAVGIGYNCFIIVVWCLFALVSHRTETSPVVVFGFGRGASAAGTVIGWYLGSRLVGDAGSDMLGNISVVLVIAILATSMLIFNETTLREAIAKPVPVAAGASGEGTAQAIRVADEAGTTSYSDDAPSEGAAATASEPGDSSPDHPAKGRWCLACEQVAATYGLSKREEEVLVLLAKGNSIERIGELLGVSFNTSKSHVRNVYVKLGVHSRQELFDMIGKN